MLVGVGVVGEMALPLTRLLSSLSRTFCLSSGGPTDRETCGASCDLTPLFVCFSGFVLPASPRPPSSEHRIFDKAADGSTKSVVTADYDIYINKFDITMTNVCAGARTKRAAFVGHIFRRLSDASIDRCRIESIDFLEVGQERGAVSI